MFVGVEGVWVGVFLGYFGVVVLVCTSAFFSSVYVLIITGVYQV